MDKKIGSTRPACTSYGEFVSQKKRKNQPPTATNHLPTPQFQRFPLSKEKELLNGFLMQKINATKSLEMNTCVFQEQSIVKIQSKYITSYFMFSEI
jgi:hypothetical protein